MRAMMKTRRPGPIFMIGVLAAGVKLLVFAAVALTGLLVCGYKPET